MRPLWAVWIRHTDKNKRKPWQVWEQVTDTTERQLGAYRTHDQARRALMKFGGVR